MTKNKDKVALVTGGAGGIGTAICERLFNEGYTVVSNYRNLEKGTKWQKDEQEKGFDFKIVYGDISDFDSTQKMIEEVNKEVGTIDILVNNAGITKDATLAKMSPEQWSDVIHTNLNSIFNCSKLVLPGMLEKGWGRIINVSSVNGQKGQFGQSNYAATKAGMHGFTKSLALEVARKGITVNTVSPGYIATDMVKLIKPEILDSIIKTIPVNRLGTPEEIAGAVAYVASEDAGFMTGANLSINGGIHMF